MKQTAWLFGAMKFAVVWLALAEIAQAQQAAAAGWPNWRGPDHNGLSMEKGWLTAWPTNGPRQLWKVELGPGHADPAVVGGRVYVMGRTAKQDTVFCLNADTGETVWKYSYDAAASAYGGGPRATPAVDGKAVYTLSADGQAFCFDAASGQVVWNKNIQKELNLPMPRHNFATSPVIEGDLLLLNLGSSGLALDKKTGNVVWKSDGPSSYSSPVPFTLGGKRCVALSAATQLVVVALANGPKIASYERKIIDNVNCADPVIVGDAIFVTAGYNTGSALIGVSGGNATVMWKKGYGCCYASPVLVGEDLYMLIDSGWEKADLVCVSVKDGSVKWTQKNVGSGGLMVADGKLLVLSRGGDLILAAASPDAYTEIARAKLFSTGACWNGPVLCGGRIYAKNEKGTLLCLDVRGK
jgi:outer membrane protein assembly factor BamB